MYTDLYTRSQNRPFHIMIGLAVAAIASGVIFYFNSGSTPIRASKQVVTRQEVVNVFPSQIGLFWVVETADFGWIIYGENPSELNKIALDERDISGEKQKRKFRQKLESTL